MKDYSYPPKPNSNTIKTNVLREQVLTNYNKNMRIDTETDELILNTITDRKIFDFNTPENQNINLKDIESIMASAQLDIDEQQFIGELLEDKIDRYGVSLSNVSHMITKLKFEDNVLSADISILSTPRGKMLLKLYETERLCNLNIVEYKPRFIIENNVLREIVAIDAHIQSNYNSDKSGNNLTAIIENIKQLPRVYKEFIEKESEAQNDERVAKILPNLSGKVMRVLVEENKTHVIKDSFIAKLKCPKHNIKIAPYMHDVVNSESPDEKTILRKSVSDYNFNASRISEDMTLSFGDYTLHLIIIPS